MRRQIWLDWQSPSMRALISQRTAAMNGSSPDDSAWADWTTRLARYAEAVGELVRATLTGDRDRDSARVLLDEALAMPGLRFDPEAAALLRWLQPRSSSTARMYRMLVDANCPGEMFDEPTRFMRMYDVVADSPEEALRLLKPFVPAASRASLSCPKVLSIAEVLPGTLLGVYSATAYCFYREGT